MDEDQKDSQPSTEKPEKPETPAPPAPLTAAQGPKVLDATPKKKSRFPIILIVIVVLKDNELLNYI